MKILFITYYWPPCGGVSAQRITHFVSELAKRGHECHVVIPENPTYYSVDEALLAAIHKSVIEHRVYISDLTALIKRVNSNDGTNNVKSEGGTWKSRLLKWIRANVFIPDPKVLWLRPVILKAIKLCKEQDFDLIYTNGTPHSLHLIGRRLQEHYKQTWVADFRDPWTGIDYFDNLPLNKRSLAKHKKLEEEVIKNADRVITVSPTWAQELGQIGGRQVHCITNGYDTIVSRQPSDGFTLSHIGTLHGDRDLLPLVKVLNDLDIDNDITLQLIGSVDASLLHKLKANTTNIYIDAPGELEHHLAKREMAKASILLLPINQSRDSKGRVPAKLFEYLTTGIPILALGEINGDAAQIIADANAGITLSYDAHQEIEHFIGKVASGNTEVEVNLDVINEYSRENLAIKLEQLLEELIEEKNGQPESE